MNKKNPLKVRKYTKIYTLVAILGAILSLIVYFCDKKMVVFGIVGAVLAVIGLIDICCLIATKRNFSYGLSVFMLIINLPLFVIMIILVVADLLTGNGSGDYETLLDYSESETKSENKQSDSSENKS